MFVDVLPDTYNIDPAAVAAAVTDRTRAVIPVHLFGLCADMDAVRAAVPEHVRVLEDAACAAGGAYQGVPAGGLGDAAAFQLPPPQVDHHRRGRHAHHQRRRPGRGGRASAQPRRLDLRGGQRHHGPAPYLLPDFDVLGFNYRMTDLQGAVGLVQLAKLDGFVAERDSVGPLVRRCPRRPGVADTARRPRRLRPRVAGVRERRR